MTLNLKQTWKVARKANYNFTTNGKQFRHLEYSKTNWLINFELNAIRRDVFRSGFLYRNRMSFTHNESFQFAWDQDPWLLSLLNVRRMRIQRGRRPTNRMTDLAILPIYRLKFGQSPWNWSIKTHSPRPATTTTTTEKTNKTNKWLSNKHNMRRLFVRNGIWIMNKWNLCVIVCVIVVYLHAQLCIVSFVHRKLRLKAQTCSI